MPGRCKFCGPDGQPRYSGIWAEPSWAGVSAQDYPDMFETNFADKQLQLLDKWLVDVAVSEAGKHPPVGERAGAPLELAERILIARPGDFNAG